MYCEITNNPTFKTFPIKVVVLTLLLGTLISWISHISYYRLHGHPWKFANGPTINFGTEGKDQKSFRCDMYMLGQHKTIKSKEIMTHLTRKKSKEVKE